MIVKDKADLIAGEFARMLAAHDLSEVKYDVVNWENSLLMVFTDGLDRTCDEAITSVVRAVSAAHTDVLEADRCEFYREELEEDDEADYEDEADDTPPEIAAKLAALPRYHIDDIWESLDKGTPCVFFWVRRHFVERSVEEAEYEQTEAERNRLENEALEIQEAEYERTHPFTLLPIPPPPKKLCSEVYLTMAYEPYDDIEKGEKVTEFREYGEYYVKKLLSQPLRTVRFQRGYGGPGHAAPRQMRWTIKNIEYYNIETRESTPIASPRPGFRPTHIAIDLGSRLS